jgi:hypothetical protein
MSWSSEPAHVNMLWCRGTMHAMLSIHVSVRVAYAADKATHLTLPAQTTHANGHWVSVARRTGPSKLRCACAKNAPALRLPTPSRSTALAARAFATSPRARQVALRAHDEPRVRVRDGERVLSVGVVTRAQ